MSFDYRHWLALACLVPSLVLFAMSYDMPVFRDAGRIAALNQHEPGANYRLKSEQLNQAVKEELTPKLKLEGYGACLLALSLGVLQLPCGRRFHPVSRRRLLTYGVGALILVPVLGINAVMRDWNRGLYPVWADSMGPVLFVILALDFILLLALLPFLCRACRGLQGVGMIFKGTAVLFALACLVLTVIGLVEGDYVTLITAGGLTLFFGYFLLAAAGKTRR